MQNIMYGDEVRTKLLPKKIWKKNGCSISLKLMPIVFGRDKVLMKFEYKISLRCGIYVTSG